jgi:hypothetical protein
MKLRVGIAIVLQQMLAHSQLVGYGRAYVHGITDSLRWEGKGTELLQGGNDDKVRGLCG